MATAMTASKPPAAPATTRATTLAMAGTRADEQAAVETTFDVARGDRGTLAPPVAHAADIARPDLRRRRDRRDAGGRRRQPSRSPEAGRKPGAAQPDRRGQAAGRGHAEG